MRVFLLLAEGVTRSPPQTQTPPAPLSPLQPQGLLYPSALTHSNLLCRWYLLPGGWVEGGQEDGEIKRGNVLRQSMLSAPLFIICIPPTFSSHSALLRFKWRTATVSHNLKHWDQSVCTSTMCWFYFRCSTTKKTSVIRYPWWTAGRSSLIEERSRSAGRLNQTQYSFNSLQCKRYFTFCVNNLWLFSQRWKTPLTT